MSVTRKEPLIKSGLEGCIPRVTEKVMKVKHGVCSLDFFLCKVSRIEWNLKRISGCAGWNRISVGNGGVRIEFGKNQILFVCLRQLHRKTPDEAVM